jgi:hypothetical protein
MKFKNVLLSTSLVVLGACGIDPEDTQTKGSGSPQVAPSMTGSVPTELQSDLQFLREEEKLARDTYLTLYDKWGLKVHQNIASSEQTHTTTVLGVLEALGIADPVVSDQIGAFTNPSLADLYAQLVAKGSVSVDAALQVGATIEDLDIHDIQTMRTKTTDPGTLAILASLECGSRNHMRSFNNQLGARGLTYQAQYISAPELTSILSSAQEQCGK